MNVVILPLDTISRSSTKRTEKREESLKQFRRRRRGRRSLKQLLLLEERALKTGTEKEEEGKTLFVILLLLFACGLPWKSAKKEERKLLLNLLPKTTALPSGKRSVPANYGLQFVLSFVKTFKAAPTNMQCRQRQTCFSLVDSSIRALLFSSFLRRVPPQRQPTKGIENVWTSLSIF